MSSEPSFSPPDLAPESGWTAVDPPRVEGGRGTFVSGAPDGDCLRVAYFRQGEGDGIVGKVWFGPGAEGPPGHAHGGSIVAVLDEAMGAAVWCAGHPALAARLETDLRRMVPLGLTARFRARVDAVEGRKVRASGELLDEGGKVLAEARGLFVRLDPGRLRALFESWQRGTEMDLTPFLRYLEPDGERCG